MVQPLGFEHLFSPTSEKNMLRMFLLRLHVGL
ncbi:hypothetical protein CsSME_00009925 [Camellia sinensis var. sinensis]